MNAILAALLNGAVVSIPLSAAVWLALHLTPHGALNAATRYVVWWAAVVGLPAMYLPIHSSHSIGRAPAQAVAAPDAAWQMAERSVVSIGASSGISSERRPLFPVEVTAGRWPSWIAGTWLGFSLLMLVRLIASCVVLERRKARAFAAPDHLAARVGDWLTQCGSTRRGVRLACSPDIATPMAAGLRHPSILIPAKLLAELGPDELDQIGLHETAHLARGDDYALIIQRVLEAVFALHPVVRWITRRIDLEREIACDDFVVQATGRARPYAACLTRVVELAGGVRVSLAGAAAADERSHLTRRVEMLLDKTRHTGTRLLKVRLAAVFVALAALAFLAAKTPGLVAFAAPVPQSPQAPQTPQTPPAVQLPQRAPAQPPQTRTPATRRVEAPIMQVQVSVTDPLHRFVTGLQKEHFKLFENDDEQTIERFSGTDAPVSVGIVIDVGDTDAGKLEHARQAVEQFMKASNAEDEFFPIQFDPRRKLADGVAMALHELKQARNARKAILILSDSGLAPGSVSIGIFEAPDSHVTRGHFTVNNPADLPGLAAKIGVELRNQYVLGYRPKNAVRAGEFRNVRVDLVPPRGLPPLQANSRAGYYAPAR